MHDSHFLKKQSLYFDLRAHCNYIVAFLLISGYDCWLKTGALENVLYLNYSWRMRDAFV